MDMKKLIQQMTDIEGAGKTKQLNEGASLNVSADNAVEVATLMNLIRGMEGSKPTGDVVAPMRGDIERFRAAVADDPTIPGRDDVPGDQDLQAGALGSAVGAGLGSMFGPAGSAIGGAMGAGDEGGAGGAALGSVAGGALGGPIGAALGGAAGQMLSSDEVDDPNIPGRDDVEGDQDLTASLIGALAGGAAGALGGNALGAATGATDALVGLGGDIAGDIGASVAGALPGIAGGAIGSEVGDNLTDEGYDNEPNPDYQDHKYMTKDLSGGLNREKKAYAKAQDGDNAMAVDEQYESIKASLYAALSEKKAKPDYIDIDGDGDTKEPMKKAAKEKGSKPKKGEVPPQFKK
jgi:hypothetical protein